MIKLIRNYSTSLGMDEYNIDTDLNIKWPISKDKIITSEKDSKGLKLKELWN